MQKSNLIDKHVGARVRLRRHMMGVSQAALGDAIGVTFQQVQKYENGSNRIGAGRLLKIANLLQVPVDFFFEDAPDLAGPSRQQIDDSFSVYASEFFSTSDGLKLAATFMKIADARLRRRIVELAEEVAANQEAPGEI